METNCYGGIVCSFVVWLGRWCGINGDEKKRNINVYRLKLNHIDDRKVNQNLTKP